MIIRKFIKLFTPILKKIKTLLNPRLDTYAERFLWRYRHYIIPNSLSDFGEHKGKRREQIVNLIQSKVPFRSLIDIGCGNGLNIDILSKKIPDSQFHGIDINKKVIKLNQERSQKQFNCKYCFGNIDNLHSYESDSFDYVLTDSVLIYIHPNNLIRILNELKRIAIKGIILREQYSEKTIYEGHWIHNYSDVLKDLRIEKYEIIKTFGQKGLWHKYGYIFDINL